MSEKDSLVTKLDSLEQIRLNERIEHKKTQERLSEAVLRANDVFFKFYIVFYFYFFKAETRLANFQQQYNREQSFRINDSLNSMLIYSFINLLKF